MNLNILIAFSFFIFLAAFWPDAATQAATINVDFPANNSCNKNSAGLSVNIAMSCPSPTNPRFTITPKASGLARVESLGTDTATDILRITNSLITANQNLTNYHIIFYRDDPAGPNTASQNVFYKLWLNGNIPAGNSLTASATVEHPIPSAPLPVGSKTVTGVFNTSATAVQWTQVPMPNPRKLKVDMTINLAAGRVLDLGNWVKLASQPTSDIPPDDHIWLFSTTGEITKKWFGDTASLTEDGMVKKEAQVSLFMHYNWDHLSQEFAQGGGGYLMSLASLLEIPPGNHPSFFELAHGHFAELLSKGQDDPQEMLQLLCLSKIRNACVSESRQN